MSRRDQLLSLACLLSLSEWTLCLEAPETRGLCVSQYEERNGAWLSMSGAMSVYVQANHRPEWYWQEVFERRGLPDRGVLGDEDSRVDRLSGEAQGQILGCGVHGGRYWEIQMYYQRLYDLAPKSMRTKILKAFAESSGANRPRSGEELPPSMRVTLCIPAECDKPMIRETIIPRFFAPKHVGLEPYEAKDALQNALDVNELADWSDINIDFVIGGVFFCGTTSLHRNLDKHPELAFSSPEEDYFITAQMAHRLLPLKSDVAAFNQQLEAAKDAKAQATGHRPHLVGIRNPMIFHLPLARHKIARITKAKMILILCDPLGRLEKAFMFHLYCFQGNLAEAKQQGLASNFTFLGSPRDDTCFDSASVLLTERDGELKSFWQHAEVAVHVPNLAQLFRGRMMVVHQEQLRRIPKNVFASLAHFLKVSPELIPSSTRHNSIGGHRTDLCTCNCNARSP
ncbi:unnamed protein product [Durusdinium trenchii]|uniref:Uncharacterized protein n=3 Tax=Durusdinium trenchii TaxID=1381693 RepID=A0ABP0QBJ6_9DINO